MNEKEYRYNENAYYFSILSSKILIFIPLIFALDCFKRGDWAYLITYSLICLVLMSIVIRTMIKLLKGRNSFSFIKINENSIKMGIHEDGVIFFARNGLIKLKEILKDEIECIIVPLYDDFVEIYLKTGKKHRVNLALLKNHDRNEIKTLLKNYC